MTDAFTNYHNKHILITLNTKELWAKFYLDHSWIPWKRRQQWYIQQYSKREVISFHPWLENAKINRDRGERSVVQHPNFVHKANLSKNQHRRKTNFEKSEKEILKIFERTLIVNFKGVLLCASLLTAHQNCICDINKNVKSSPKAQKEVFCNGSFYIFISCSGLDLFENIVSGKPAIMNLIQALLIL